MKQMLALVDGLGHGRRSAGEGAAGSEPLPAAATRQGRKAPERVSGEDEERDVTWAKLMIAAQNGDKRSYARLLAESAEVVRSAARRHGIEGNSADLFVRETLTLVHEARHTYDPSRSFAAWLTRLAQRSAAEFLRRRRYRAGRATSMFSGT